MRRLALAAACCAALVGAQSARADGDPASDYLLVQHVFVPFEGAVAAKQQHALMREVATVNKAGFAIRVAVIFSNYDLGSVTSLWRKPQTYARFLGVELSFVYKQRLLVVMPNGFGFNWVRHPSKDGYAVLSGVPVQPGTTGLISSATVAVQKLAAAAGVKT